MTDWVNFAEIRARVSLEQVIFDYYGLTGFKRKGQRLTGPCPVHGGDSPRAFHAELSRNVWHCFTGCQGGGNQLDFVAKREGISIREAALRLQAHFLGSETSAAPVRKPAEDAEKPAQAPRESETDERPNPPLNVNLKLRGDHPHLVQDRRLAEETIAHFGVGYCSKGILRGMIAIPIKDENGTLVAYAGRRLKPQDIREHGKYKFPSGFRKELVLYGWHEATATASDDGVVVVEGFFSVMKLHEAGISGVVATMGCEVSIQQLEFLAQAKDVIVLYDGDAPGRKGAEALKEKLGERTTVRLVRLPDGLEPDDLEPRALRWLVNGVRALGIIELEFRLE